MTKCSKTGCEAEATHVPRVKAWAVSDPQHRRGPLELRVGVKLCEPHAREFKPEPGSLDALMAGWGKVAADMATAKVTPLAIDSDEYRQHFS